MTTKKLSEILEQLDRGIPLSCEELKELGLIKKENFHTGSPFEVVQTWFLLKPYWVSSSGIFDQPCFAPTGSYQKDLIENIEFQKSQFNGFWGEYLGEDI